MYFQPASGGSFRGCALPKQRAREQSRTLQGVAWRSRRSRGKDRRPRTHLPSPRMICSAVRSSIILFLDFRRNGAAGRGVRDWWLCGTRRQRPRFSKAAILNWAPAPKSTRTPSFWAVLSDFIVEMSKRISVILSDVVSLGQRTPETCVEELRPTTRRYGCQLS